MSEYKTFCTVCEAVCGMIATVENDRVVKLRPDPDHPISRGSACPKGIAFTQVLEDPDRVVKPLIRQNDGSFAEASWDEALDRSASRLRAVIEEHGPKSVGVYLGNPATSNVSAPTLVGALAAALGTQHYFTSASVDINHLYLTNHLLYGNMCMTAFPDVDRSDFVLVVGANPVVSHGSMWTTGRVREQLRDVVERGGRVVVVDPRRTETARLFEHVAVRPGEDVWLFSGMLKVIFDEGLSDDSAIAAQTRGADELRRLIAMVDLQKATSRSGIPTEVIQDLARSFARASAASIHTRCGTSLSQFSTLARYFSEALPIVTGNLDRPGGNVFGDAWISFEEMTAGASGWNRWATRVDGFPEVCGQSPIAAFANEVETPGEGQLRALICVCGNPATTGPRSDRIRDALGKLDLLIALDPYITETSRHADVVLPPTLWMERETAPLFSQLHMAIPTAQWCGPLVSPRGETRDDGWILAELARRAGIELELPASAEEIHDGMLRMGPYGDGFGERPEGLTRERLMSTGEPVKLRDAVPTGVLGSRVRHDDGLVALDHPIFAEEFTRLLGTLEEDPQYPLRLISVRELRSQNSWLHNVDKLMAGHRRQRVMVHPDDAVVARVTDGGAAEVTSANGRVTLEVEVTTDIGPGVVGVNHGWGHQGTWRRAVAAGGVALNSLVPDQAGNIDVPSGNAFLNGIPVALKAISKQPPRA